MVTYNKNAQKMGKYNKMSEKTTNKTTTQILTTKTTNLTCHHHKYFRYKDEI